jgi:acetylornithine deacetylase/succinyl-diaminopimelate desuccinylase-like protein
MKTVQEYLHEHQDRFISELMAFLRIPSVSANPDHNRDVAKAAAFVAEKLSDAGADNVSVIPTQGHPVVFGEKIVNRQFPTIMIYGHYDVQPADPLELWSTPPFDPVIRKTDVHPEGAIFARGSCDDKGQVYMHIKAFEAMMACNDLPCNIKFMIEGEEEIGSANLATFLEDNKSKLAADVILISDTSLIANDIPSITVGLRGLSYVEVAVVGPNKDLHSGVYGGAVGNPINILSKMIASMHDENNRITIPGFYDSVAEVSSQDRLKMNEAPFSLENYQSDLNIDSVHGEAGYTVLERTAIRPTLDVNGIWGGYTGEGAKTVLPSKAFAKISMRLVPHQNPDVITELFKNYFESIAPPAVRVTVTPHHGGHPVVTPTDTAEYKAAQLAMQHTFGKDPIPQRGGGSIPIVALFEKVLGIKSVLMGFGLDSDDIHSPNEHYGLFNYFKGMETIPYYFKYYAELKK